MLKIVFGLVIIFELVSCIWNFLRAKIFLCKEKGFDIQEEPQSHDIKPEILIVIPCLREQDIIFKTLEHFLNIIKDYHEINLVVITTEKENTEKKKNLYKVKQLI